MAITGAGQLRPLAQERVSRDPEDRRIPQEDEHARREKSLDKTVADSFPTSDPPSTIPDPSGDG
jgi:hypothetical protein